MNILKYSISLFIILECVIASESNVKGDVIEAVGEDGFVSIKGDWETWKKRNDLFDYVVMEDPDFIIRFINYVGMAKRRTLAALFIKRSDAIDKVLKEINYDDNDLIWLTNRRIEVAESPDKLFRVLNKIENPKNEETLVGWCVIDLFNGEKHDLIIPLIDALGKRPCRSGSLKVIAIQSAFHGGASRGIKYIVEEFHKNPAITSQRYAKALIASWIHDGSKIIFPFLLSQADEGDLEMTRNDWGRCREEAGFWHAIDKARKIAPPAGTRHARFFERVKLGIKTLNDVMSTGEWIQEPGIIIASYLLAEPEGTNVMKEMRQEGATSKAMESTKQKSMCCIN